MPLLFPDISILHLSPLSVSHMLNEMPDETRNTWCSYTCARSPLTVKAERQKVTRGGCEKSVCAFLSLWHLKSWPCKKKTLSKRSLQSVQPPPPPTFLLSQLFLCSLESQRHRGNERKWRKEQMWTLSLSLGACVCYLFPQWEQWSEPPVVPPSPGTLSSRGGRSNNGGGGRNTCPGPSAVCSIQAARYRER